MGPKILAMHHCGILKHWKYIKTTRLRRSTGLMSTMIWTLLAAMQSTGAAKRMKSVTNLRQLKWPVPCTEPRWYHCRKYFFYLVATTYYIWWPPDSDVCGILCSSCVSMWWPRDSDVVATGHQIAMYVVFFVLLV